ncbi:MAG: phosphatase PAP2 family protein [Lachnospiraceae bacterium]|nr:phosphatase PAP2 family protein [Lachnospiraceae bacterium]
MKELMILSWIQTHLQSEIGDQTMMFVTALGDGGFIWIVLGLAFCSSRQYRKTGIMVLAALLLGMILGNQILKPLFERPRPFEVSQISLLIPPPGEYSFPSGHTTSSFAAAFVLLFRKDRMRFAALGLAALVAFSRLYLYVHYPTDILGGIVLGGISAWLAIRCVNKIERYYLARLPLR